MAYNADNSTHGLTFAQSMLVRYIVFYTPWRGEETQHIEMVLYNQ